MTLRLSVLLWLFAVHLIGIYLFTRGFLLSRLSLSNHSICPDGFPNCTLPPTHKRAVVLVIDALRFDFISPQPPLPSSPHHHNLLTLPRVLTENYPTRSFIFNAYADPPTTTLQRIKALTTGSLPTFIDMGNNFGGSSIMEDSILNQLRLAGKTAAFMGDDTWISVFPDAFHPNMTFPYDSFNVEDLHTVDEGVITHLFPLLNDDSKPFDFLIGHFLGVDHVGHRIGPDHPSMTAKLKQMNDVLTRVVEDLDDQTLLVVLGDHGMDRSGDHGGDGVLETSAALWIYSKGSELSAATALSNSLPSGLLQHRTFPGCPTQHRTIQQIDILPTLSLLLGLPIPYNNLGSIIPEVFWRPAGEGSKVKPSSEVLKHALEINSAQIKTYLNTYRLSGSGSELEDAWDQVQRSWDAIHEAVSSNNTQGVQLLSLNSFNRVALAACRSMWAQFDPILMGFGLAVLCAGLISACFVYAALKKARNDWHSWVKKHVPYCIFGTGAGVILGVCAYFLVAVFFPSASIRVMDLVLVFAAMSSCLGFIITSVSTSNSNLSSYDAFLSFPAIFILHTCAFFSNSWTFWEDRIVPFLLATSVLVNFVPVGFTAPSSRLRRRILGFSTLFLVCVRLMAISTVCREEQQPYCHVTFFASSSIPSPPVVILILALPTAVVIVPLMVQRILRITKSDAGIASLLVSIIVRPSLVAGTLFWIAEWADSSHMLIGANEGSGGAHHQFWTAELRGIRTWLARFAFGWPIVAGLGLWWLVPLCVQVQVKETVNNENPNVSKSSSPPTCQVTILGFANAFGAPYLMFWTLFFCIVYASLQLTAQVVLGLALVALLAYLEVIDSVRDARIMESVFATEAPSSILSGTSSSTSTSLSPATQFHFSEVVPIALLGLLAFYATGHQSTVSSIQWKAAFMLTGTVKYPWAPLTVGINFLGPITVISGLGVVFLAVWNRGPALFDPKSGRMQTEGGNEAVVPSERYDAQVTADSNLAGLGIMIYYGAILLGTAMSAAILRRHLMVWKVFAPRFMAAVIHLLVVDVSVLVGVGVGVGRISSKIGTVFKGVVKE